MGLELRWPKFPCEFGHDGPHFSNLIIGTEREKGEAKFTVSSAKR